MRKLRNYPSKSLTLNGKVGTSRSAWMTKRRVKMTLRICRANLRQLKRKFDSLKMKSNLRSKLINKWERTWKHKKEISSKLKRRSKSWASMWSPKSTQRLKISELSLITSIESRRTLSCYLSSSRKRLGWGRGPLMRRTRPWSTQRSPRTRCKNF